MTPQHGQKVIVSFPGESDWKAEAIRISKDEEDQARWEQGWQEESIVLEFTSSPTGTLPAAVYDFLGDERGNRLFFDVAPWSETGWSLLLERDEFPVSLNAKCREEYS